MKSRQLLDFISHLMCFFLMIAMQNAFASEGKNIDWCKIITHQKTTHSILLDENSNLISGSLNLGSSTVTASSDEGIEANKKFRIILFPKDLTLDSLDGQVVSESFKRIKPQCPLTSEYIVSIGLYPPRMGAGKFEYDMHVELHDPKSDNPDPVETITRKVTGILFMPWIKVQDTKTLNSELKNLLNNSDKSVEIQLTNAGNKPIQLGAWQVGNKQSQDLHMQDKSCENQTIRPLEVCSVILSKTGQGQLKEQAYIWYSLVENGNGVPIGNASVGLFVTIEKNGNVNVFVKNE
jgi:hypothetical protein